MAGAEGLHFRHLPGIDQDVIDQPLLLQPLDAGIEGRRLDEGGDIGFILDLVTKAQQLVASPLRHVGGQVRRGQVFPSHHPGNAPVSARQVQQETGLFAPGACLHGNRGVQAFGGQQGMQLPRQTIAGQQLHALAYPGIILGAIAPEMLVGVDAKGLHDAVSGGGK
ncbi:hypothetical protein J2S30_004696 [Herbaspirillum rubrisubalbicans]|nr:hypothetical protein [Herbaspirillum rubrisubalbicans]